MIYPSSSTGGHNRQPIEQMRIVQSLGVQRLSDRFRNESITDIESRQSKDFGKSAKDHDVFVADKSDYYSIDDDLPKQQHWSSP